MLNAVKVIKRINTPPQGIALLSDFSSFAERYLTTNWGWARTPIPTPNIKVSSSINAGEKASGIEVLGEILFQEDKDVLYSDFLAIGEKIFKKL